MQTKEVGCPLDIPSIPPPPSLATPTHEPLCLHSAHSPRVFHFACVPHLGGTAPSLFWALRKETWRHLNFSFPFLPRLSPSPFHAVLLSLPTCALNSSCPVRRKPLSSHVIVFQPRSVNRHFQELLMLSLPLYLCICCSFFLECPFLPHLLGQRHIPEDSALEALSEYPYLSGRE